MADDIKTKLYNYCVTAIEEKLAIINSVLNNAQDSANHETKSTAGDKHDTARAMAHLESEKNAKQLGEINKLKKVLPYLKDHKTKDVADLGSLVKTNAGNYYLSISLGKANIDNATYFLISAVTPIGKLLIGKNVGDAIKFNGKAIEIKEII
jgi:transcription elongation GreA/GreB family factor